MHHMGMGAEALKVSKKLTNKDHIKVLSVFVDSEPYYLSFEQIRLRLASDTNNNKKLIRRIVRHLARQGLVSFGKGLFNEDGNVAGSGYTVTKLGVVVFNIVSEEKRIVE